MISECLHNFYNLKIMRLFDCQQIFLEFKRLKSRSLLNPFVNLCFEFSFVTLIKEQ